MAYDAKSNTYYGYIYLITNKINGWVYVGQTACDSIDLRWKTHLNAAFSKSSKKKQILIDKVINKYGEDCFDIVQLIRIEDKNDDKMRSRLDSFEKKFIEIYDSHVRSGHGYNVSHGGRMVAYDPPLYDIYDMSGNLLYDKKTSNEASELCGCKVNMIHQISNGSVGNYHNRYVIRKEGQPFGQYDTTIAIKVLYQYSPTGELVNIYPGGRPEAEKTLGYKIHSINDEHRLCNGYAWSNTGKCEYKGRLRWTKTQKIDVYTLDGILIDSDVDIYECSRMYNIIADEILKACNGSYGKSHNMVFRIHGDSFDKYDVVKQRDYTDISSYYYIFNINTQKLETGCYGFANVEKYIGKTFTANAINNIYSSIGDYWVSTENKYLYAGNPYKKRVDMYTESGAYIRTFGSVSECARELGLNRTFHISDCCKGKIKHVGGFILRYAGDPFVLTGHEHDSRSDLYNISVNMYDASDNYIRTFNSLSSAAKEMPNGRPNVIRSVCDKVRSTAYNYKWFYSTDESQPDKAKIERPVEQPV